MLKHRMWFAVIGLFAIGCAGPTGMTGSQGQPGVPGPVFPVVRGTPLKDIRFDFDKAEIRPVEMSKVSEIATYMSQNPAVRLSVSVTCVTR